jgi:hypothetical protein
MSSVTEGIHVRILTSGVAVPVTESCSPTTALNVGKVELPGGDRELDLTYQSECSVSYTICCGADVVITSHSRDTTGFRLVLVSDKATSEEFWVD